MVLFSMITQSSNCHVSSQSLLKKNGQYKKEQYSGYDSDTGLRSVV